MNNGLQKEIVLEKKIEAILGILFLIPPILGVVAFTINLFGGDGVFPEMSNLSRSWVADADGGMSATPFYLGLMAIVGTLLIRGNLRYLLKKKEQIGNNPEV